MAEDNIGEFYVKIRGDVKDLEKDVKAIWNKLDRDLPPKKLTFDTSLGKMKLNELERYHTKLKSVVERKIALNMDVESIRRSNDQLRVVEEVLKNIKGKAEATGEKLSRWATITTGINQGFELIKNTFGELKNLMGESVTAANSLEVLRSNFKGTTEDLELFRRATAGTVSEANLIKLSNQATDLGITLEQQAILFAMSEDAADKYGTSVEDGMMKVIGASEGQTKALKSLGIQKEVFETIITDLAKAQGQTIDKLDAETQKQIRLQAIIRASGLTLDEVKNKVKDNADKYESLSVRVEEAKVAFGNLISKALIPLISLFDDSSKGAKDVMSAVIGIGGVAFQAIPILVQLKTSQSLLAAAAAMTATKMDVATGAVNRFKLAGAGLWGIIGLALTAGGIVVSSLMENSIDMSIKTAEKKAAQAQDRIAAQRFKRSMGIDDMKPVSPHQEISKIKPEVVHKHAQAYKEVAIAVKEVIKNVKELTETENTKGNEKLRKLQLEVEVLSKLPNAAERWYGKSIELIQAQTKELLASGIAWQDAIDLEKLKIDELNKAYLNLTLRKKESNQIKTPRTLAPVDTPAENPYQASTKLDKYLELIADGGPFDGENGFVNGVEVSMSMAQGFTDGFFEDIVIQSERANSLLEKAFVGMANSFIQQVQRMIAEWLVLEAIKMGMNILTGGASSAATGALPAPVAARGGNFIGASSGIKKFATGGSFIVPQGFPNDTYPMLVQSGERVSVTSANQTSMDLRVMNDVLNAIRAMNMNLVGLRPSIQVINNAPDIITSVRRISKTQERLSKGNVADGSSL